MFSHEHNIVPKRHLSAIPTHTMRPYELEALDILASTSAEAYSSEHSHFPPRRQEIYRAQEKVALLTKNAKESGEQYQHLVHKLMVAKAERRKQLQHQARARRANAICQDKRSAQMSRTVKHRMMERVRVRVPFHSHNQQQKQEQMYVPRRQRSPMEECRELWIMQQRKSSPRTKRKAPFSSKSLAFFGGEKSDSTAMHNRSGNKRRKITHSYVAHVLNMSRR